MAPASGSLAGRRPAAFKWLGALLAQDLEFQVLGLF